MSDYRFSKLTQRFLLSFIFSSVLLSAIAADKNKTHVMMISGGGEGSSNNYRYENNVKLFADVLGEKGYNSSNMTLFFNEGKSSRVHDEAYENMLHKSMYGVKYDKPSIFRPTVLRDMITGPAFEKDIRAQFASAIEQAKKGEIDNFVLFTTDHGTSHDDDYSKSYITLTTKGEKLTVEEIDKFVKELAKYKVPVAVIGTQCFSGANMSLGLNNDNACAFSAAEAYETSRAFPGYSWDVKKYNLPELSFSEYSFLFSCALHDSKKQRLQKEAKTTGKSVAELKKAQPADHPLAYADRSCEFKKKKIADFDKDGKVSLAEAHYFALYKMSSESAPQISSQKYVSQIYGNRAGKVGDDIIGDISTVSSDLKTCLGKDRDQFLEKTLSASGAVLLKEHAQKMLDMKKHYLLQMIKDADWKIYDNFWDINSSDSVDKQLKRISEIYHDYKRNYDQLLAEVASAMKKLNNARATIQSKKEDFITKVMLKNAAFKKDYDLYKKLEQLVRPVMDQAVAAAAAAATTTPPATMPSSEDMMNYLRLKEKIAQNVEKEYNRVHAVDVIKLEQKEKTYQGLVDRLGHRPIDGKDFEGKMHANHAKIRRVYELAQGYMAELHVLKNGTPEQLLKLSSLYQCENHTL
ncbi:MAG: hypothetical protein HQK50_00060 [Oligoflexia bacterium]|nr:hypothetical protein [Oligoflexia bacterium]MBF0363927.1 hypothetical protein [Oligoflexia bacterium]